MCMLPCNIFNTVTLKHSTNVLLIANRIFSPSIPLCFPSTPSLLPFSLKKNGLGQTYVADQKQIALYDFLLYFKQPAGHSFERELLPVIPLDQ